MRTSITGTEKFGLFIASATFCVLASRAESGRMVPPRMDTNNAAAIMPAPKTAARFFRNRCMLRFAGDKEFPLFSCSLMDKLSSGKKSESYQNTEVNRIYDRRWNQPRQTIPSLGKHRHPRQDQDFGKEFDEKCAQKKHFVTADIQCKSQGKPKKIAEERQNHRPLVPRIGHGRIF